MKVMGRCQPCRDTTSGVFSQGKASTLSSICCKQVARAFFMLEIHIVGDMDLHAKERLTGSIWDSITCWVEFWVNMVCQMIPGEPCCGA